MKPFGLLRDASSPDDGFVESAAALLARREVPLGAVDPEMMWPASGVVGRDVSEVVIGVTSVEVALLLGTLFDATASRLVSCAFLYPQRYNVYLVTDLG